VPRYGRGDWSESSIADTKPQVTGPRLLLERIVSRASQKDPRMVGDERVWRDHATRVRRRMKRKEVDVRRAIR
jgi:hypothetical protein